MVAMRFVKVYGGLTRAIEPISKTVDSEDKEARIDRINDRPVSFNMFSCQQTKGRQLQPN
jgi:hypothetical protein